MKHFNTLLSLLLCLLFSQASYGQVRYLDQIFSNVTVDQDLVYGENFTVLFLAVPEIAAPVREPLVMDFYQPEGDTVSNRPLVILAKTGNFLPIASNGTVQGTKRDSATVEIATRLAQAGYVVATIDYRLGWNPTAPTQPERALQLIQAAYRGTQDARTAVRFFKRNLVEEGNTYGVDTSRITIWGMGTGGYISMATSTLTEYNKILTTTNPPGKFFFDPTGGNNPTTPMIIESINGDIFGTSLGIVPEDAPPLSAGDTLCLPNHVGFSSDYQLTVNQGGALGDLSWFDEDARPPVITFHVPTDPNAPYGDAVLTVPTTGDLIVQVQGGIEISARANEIGVNDVFEGIETMFPEHPYVANITQAAKDASAKAAYSDLNGDFDGHEFSPGNYPFIRPFNPNGPQEGDPWNWWEPSVWDTIPNLLADPNGNITFDQSARASHPDASPEKGRIYIDTVMGFFLPRAYIALNLDAVTNVREVLNANEVELSISPNPSPGIVRFITAANHPMKHIHLYDMMGRLVLTNANINTSYAEINRGNLAAGNYVAYIRFEEGIVAKQIVFR